MSKERKELAVSSRHDEPEEPLRRYPEIVGEPGRESGPPPLTIGPNQRHPRQDSEEE
jgi:hypothetical protein